MNAQTEVPIDRPRRTPRTVSDRVLGALGAGMVLLALIVLIRGGMADGTQPLTSPPLLVLLEPTAGGEVDGPLALVFDVQAQLERQPAGWGVGGYHLHLQLDGLELMPGPADVTPVRSGGYRWVVGELEPGTHRLQLFWSDAQHRRVEGGESEVIEVQTK